jgi:hypothetical protein
MRHGAAAAINAAVTFLVNDFFRQGCGVRGCTEVHFPEKLFSLRVEV